jgi:hypothetical protein
VYFDGRIQRFCGVVALALGLLAIGLVTAHKERKGETVDAGIPPASSSQPHSRIGMQNVRLPLRASVGGEEIQGEALLARVHLGSGKLGSGLLGVLAPALRVEGAVLETDDSTLALLSDLYRALSEMTQMEAIEFRGLRVRSRAGNVLLECVSASVSGKGVWELRYVRGERFQMESFIRVDPSALAAFRLEGREP